MWMSHIACHSRLVWTDPNWCIYLWPCTVPLTLSWYPWSLHGTDIYVIPSRSHTTVGSCYLMRHTLWYLQWWWTLIMNTIRQWNKFLLVNITGSLHSDWKKQSACSRSICTYSYQLYSFYDCLCRQKSKLKKKYQNGCHLKTKVSITKYLMCIY